MTHLDSDLLILQYAVILNIRTVLMPAFMNTLMLLRAYTTREPMCMLIMVQTRSDWGNLASTVCRTEVCHSYNCDHL